MRSDDEKEGRLGSDCLRASGVSVQLFAAPVVPGQVPAAGYEVFGPGQPPRLCVNLELFRLASKRVTILQQRAPVLPGEEEKFAEGLVLWARKEGFKVGNRRLW